MSKNVRYSNACYSAADAIHRVPTNRTAIFASVGTRCIASVDLNAMYGVR
jgi:hypothetical protein